MHGRSARAGSSQPSLRPWILIPSLRPGLPAPSALATPDVSPALPVHMSLTYSVFLNTRVSPQPFSCASALPVPTRSGSWRFSSLPWRLPRMRHPRRPIPPRPTSASRCARPRSARLAPTSPLWVPLPPCPRLLRTWVDFSLRTWLAYAPAHRPGLRSPQAPPALLAPPRCPRLAARLVALSAPAAQLARSELLSLR